MWRHMEIFFEQSKTGPKVYIITYSQVVTQPGTDATQQDLTSVIKGEPVLYLWCGRKWKKQVKSCLIAWTL